MPFTISDYLTPIQTDIPSSLIGDQALTDIRQVARMMPGPATAFFGFECRLGTDDTQADFLLCAKPHESGRRILAGNDMRWSLPDALYTEQAWDRMHAFCRDWDDPDSPLHDLVHNVWLEFDLADGVPDTPIPSVFFGNYKTIYGSNTSDDNLWITDRALPLLMEDTLSDETRRMLHTCFAELPDQAYVFQIGVMLARNVDAVRICIRDIAPDVLSDYLSRIGWPGSETDIRSLVTELAGRVDRVDLDIDVGSTVYPKVGLECYLHQQPSVESRWDGFLDYLVALDLCTDSKRTGLLAYPGGVHEKQAEETWPEHLKKASLIMGTNALSTILRRLHHIKVVYQPDTPMEAKAYLSVEHHWIDIAALTAALQSGQLDGLVEPEEQHAVAV